MASCYMSHPVRVRGLKHVFTLNSEGIKLVAPRAGAWIETRTGRQPLYAYVSHPVRVRGLKPVRVMVLFVSFLSHPVRVRGLKPGLAYFSRR